MSYIGEQVLVHKSALKNFNFLMSSPKPHRLPQRRIDLIWVVNQIESWCQIEISIWWFSPNNMILCSNGRGRMDTYYLNIFQSQRPKLSTNSLMRNPRPFSGILFISKLISGSYSKNHLSSQNQVLLPLQITICDPSITCFQTRLIFWHKFEAFWWWVTFKMRSSPSLYLLWITRTYKPFLFVIRSWLTFIRNALFVF